MLIFKIILLLSSFLRAYADENGPYVNTVFGTVKGTYSLSYNNKPFSSFRSIPFAEPPIGTLRFREPLPQTPWKGIWVANKTTECIQTVGGQVEGSEDCLYLNIYVPSRHPADIKTKLPVMVHIHGGAFMFGYGERYAGPLHFMDKNVILVTFNYRLGAFGFMSTQDEVMPGNNGLKDQVAALKWIKNNIASFGGDPNEVTIMGMSAGGASVHYLLLSEMSAGLFKNAISVSGSALDPWTLQDASLEKAKRLASSMGCNQICNREMVECLKTKPAEQIAQKTNDLFFVWRENPFSPFAPVIEPKSKTWFLKDHPYKLISQGKILDVPWVATFSTDEGIYPAAGWWSDPQDLPYLDQMYDQLCPFIFDFNYTLPVQHHKEVCSNIKNFYLQDQSISRTSFNCLVKALSDRLFIETIEKSAKLQATKSKSPVYLYEFSYLAEKVQSYSVLFFPVPRLGVAHGDEMMFIFSQNHINVTFTPSENDKKMQEILFDLYLSFAKTGVPSHQSIIWEPVNPHGHLNYLLIKSPQEISMKTTDTLANAQFWDKINFNENENYH